MRRIEIVRSIYAAFDRRDLAAIFEHLAPHTALSQSSQLPWGGHYVGADGVKSFLGKLTHHISSRVTVDRMLDSGDSVVVLGVTEGEVRSSGALFAVPVAHVWTFEGPSVVRIDFFIDNPEMLKALNSCSRPEIA